ncbi:hypothetical protein GUJ93_ZPchr0007g3153 [Zizania palustris]|uniref:Uncharacterized protein n=1 Tax=Zizania palustris TaxID=103762 RepID=A0A8J5W6J7_ZIZPA|nr:hypothetical protein GUJ93_ZPchr0007g3153 [Zizania palustris]
MLHVIAIMSTKVVRVEIPQHLLKRCSLLCVRNFLIYTGTRSECSHCCCGLPRLHRCLDIADVNRPSVPIVGG